MQIKCRVITGLGIAIFMSTALGGCDKSNDSPQVQQTAKPADQGQASSGRVGETPNSSLAGAKRAAQHTADRIEQHQRELEHAADEK